MIDLPSLDERDVDGASATTRAEMEWTRSPEQGDAVGRVVRVKGNVRHERLHLDEKKKRKKENGMKRQMKRQAARWTRLSAKVFRLPKSRDKLVPLISSQNMAH